MGCAKGSPCGKAKAVKTPRTSGAKSWSSPKPKSSEKTFVFKDGKKYEIRT